MILIIGFIAYRGRKHTLQNLALLTDEEIIFDDENQLYWNVTKAPIHKRNVHLRITNQRIILSNANMTLTSQQWIDTIFLLSQNEKTNMGLYPKRWVLPKKITIHSTDNQLHIASSEQDDLRKYSIIMTISNPDRYLQWLESIQQPYMED